jgi:hypothetical protein
MKLRLRIRSSSADISNRDRVALWIVAIVSDLLGIDQVASRIGKRGRITR